MGVDDLERWVGKTSLLVLLNLAFFAVVFVLFSHYDAH